MNVRRRQSAAHHNRIAGAHVLPSTAAASLRMSGALRPRAKRVAIVISSKLHTQGGTCGDRSVEFIIKTQVARLRTLLFSKHAQNASNLHDSRILKKSFVNLYTFENTFVLFSFFLILEKSFADPLTLKNKIQKSSKLACLF